MCKLLSEWMPSDAALNVIKLNEVTEEQIKKSLNYLKSQSELNSIDDVEGYENWNAFFIMFCVKANKKNE